MHFFLHWPMSPSLLEGRRQLQEVLVAVVQHVLVCKADSWAGFASRTRGHKGRGQQGRVVASPRTRSTRGRGVLWVRGLVLSWSGLTKACLAHQTAASSSKLSLTDLPGPILAKIFLQLGFRERVSLCLSASVFLACKGEGAIHWVRD